MSYFETTLAASPASCATFARRIALKLAGKILGIFLYLHVKLQGDACVISGVSARERVRKLDRCFDAAPGAEMARTPFCRRLTR